MTSNVATPFYNLKDAIAKNRLVGLWRIMTGFRLTYFGATFSLGLAATAKTLTLFLLRYLVDDVLGQGDINSELIFLALGFVVLAVFEGGFSFLSGKLAAQTAEGIALRLRDYLFDHIQRLSFAYHDKTQTGELLQRATSDVEAIRVFFADQAVGVGRIIMLFAINFIALLSLHWQLALISVVVIPFIVLMSLFFFKRIVGAYESFQEQEATLSTVLQENLTGVRVVKAFARQKYERDKFEQENWEKYRRGKRLLLLHSLYWPFSNILANAQMLGGLLIGALMAIDGQITVGTYLAYSGMLVWIIWPMRNLGRVVVQASMGVVSYGRVMEIVKENREPLEKDKTPPVSDLRGEIVFRDVCFEYETGASVLKNVSFRCEPGQVIALMGATGSGKTSLVNLLPRFYEATSGSLTLDGVDLTEYPRYFLRQHIGIVEQEPFLFSRTIRKNIRYGVSRDVSDDEVEEAARAAAIHDTILSFPEGYDTLVGEKGVTLSGGQKQRVVIARTLLKNPRILIMDDATSSVDTETEAVIRGALERLMENRTTFVIAHRIQSVMSADLILVLDKGEIVQQGTNDELIAQHGIYQQIHDAQTRIEDEMEKEIAGVGLEI